eukprot:gene23134-biopygen23806
MSVVREARREFFWGCGWLSCSFGDFSREFDEASLCGAFPATSFEEHFGTWPAVMSRPALREEREVVLLRARAASNQQQHPRYRTSNQLQHPQDTGPVINNNVQDTWPVINSNIHQDTVTAINNNIQGTGPILLQHLRSRCDLCTFRCDLYSSRWDLCNNCRVFTVFQSMMQFPMLHPQRLGSGHASLVPLSVDVAPFPGTALRSGKTCFCSA